MNPKILILDTLYDAFLKTVPIDPNAGYEENLKNVLDRGFGTADFCSRNLRALGWVANDVIANSADLQRLWCEWTGYENHHGILRNQIDYYQADVVFVQDLSIAQMLHHRPRSYVVAAQCSCPWPGDEAIRCCDVVFTSFPHYVPRIEALGVRAVYNPLAFEPGVLYDLTHVACKKTGALWGRKLDRIHDVVFIGGVGAPSHWRYGMEVLETVAREIPTFKWWGYGLATLPADSALRSKYQGEAYGLDMYEILLQSKICLNRHGEVAEGYANNMRLFEASGAGALLLTEEAPNLSDFFTKEEAVGYSSPTDAVEKIRYLLDRWEYSKVIAMRGQARTLRDHTYSQRMKTVSETLETMLCPA